MREEIQKKLLKKIHFKKNTLSYKLEIVSIGSINQNLDLAKIIDKFKTSC